ncbi:tail fiber domain-containing protein, partial [Patescibacteria group bacterium]|nr:tail fiber domain-containing protein [Patescibacteria group bacterium]
GYLSATDWTTFNNKVSMVYPGAGIALSTGSAWDTSITNNSANWNTAYTDRLKWDGGSAGLVAATGRTSLELGSMSLLANTGSTTITTLGTIGTGIWNGTPVGTQWGGTGQNWLAVATGSIAYFSDTGVMNTLAKGSDTQVLTLASGIPSWAAAAGGGEWTDSGTVLYPNEIGLDNVSIGTTTEHAKLTVQSTSTTDILNLFETGGTEVFTVLESGNVGIGTTSPEGLLQVVRPEAGVGTITVTASGTSIIGTGTQFTTDFNLGDNINANAESHVITAIASDTAMTTTAWTGAATDVAYTVNKFKRLTIDSFGNVGLGKLPHSQAKLQVDGNIVMGHADEGVGISGYLGSSNDWYALNPNTYVIPNVGWRYLDDGYGGIFGFIDGGWHFFTLPLNASGTDAVASGISEKFTILNGGNVGIGVTDPDEKLEVNGRIKMTTWTADGDTAAYRDTATNAIALVTSDIRLKKDIEPLAGALDIISQLNAYKYHDLDDANEDKKRLGIMAQEVLPVIPELTFAFTREGTEEKYYGVHYDKLGALLLGGIKEQQLQIEELKILLNATSTDLTVEENQMTGQIVQLDVNELKTGLASLGLVIDENGALVIDSLKAGKLEVGTQAKPTGITLYDEATGQPYCLKIKNGQTITEAGECVVGADSVVSTTPASNTGSATTIIYYYDNDGDGYGVSNNFHEGSQIEGYVPNSDDCDDWSSAINPSAEEVCDDGIDNNCDGQIDENCEQPEPVCEPLEEICDGLDNNCDGQIDENCDCGITSCDSSLNLAGECQNSCLGTEGCGTCVASCVCAEGFNNCDNDLTNGCETQGECVVEESEPEPAPEPEIID